MHNQTTNNQLVMLTTNNHAERSGEIASKVFEVSLHRGQDFHKPQCIICIRNAPTASDTHASSTRRLCPISPLHLVCEAFT